MSTLLVKNIELLATFDDQRREVKDGAIYVRDNVVEAVATSTELESMRADEVLDLSGHIVMPGMVNVHHHMYQTLTREMVQDDETAGLAQDALSDMD
jgi:cytosine/adenosine deaminase-related metal-dependent hydrolase